MLKAAIPSSISKREGGEIPDHLPKPLTPLSCSVPLCPCHPPLPSIHPSCTQPLLAFTLSFLPSAYPSTPIVSPGGSCQSSASPTIPLELIVPAVASGGRRCEAPESRRWRERCQSLSLIINFCHSGPRGSHVAGASHSLCPSLLSFSILLFLTHSASRSAFLCPSHVQSLFTSLIPR